MLLPKWKLPVTLLSASLPIKYENEKVTAD